MKRLLSLICLLLLFWGCAAPEPTQPTTIPTTTPTTVPATEPTTVPTEPPKPWIEEVGQPWDREGALREIPLTIYDGLHYIGATEFEGDLLLWGYDSHLADTVVLELCLVELDDGTYVQKDITLGHFVSPQVLGDALYLCDSLAGTVTVLDKQFEAVKTWTLEPNDSNWLMGGNNTLYLHNWEGTSCAYDLETGEQTALLDGAQINYISSQSTTATMDYYSTQTGSEEIAVLDLMTGEVAQPPRARDFVSVDYRNGTWLMCTYLTGYNYYYGTEEELLYANTGTDELRFLGDYLLVQTGLDGGKMTLLDLQGKALASCHISENGTGMYCSALIPSEAFGGYFCLLSNYEGSLRLLYWDTTQGERGQDLEFVSLPEADDAQTQLADRARALSEVYGVHILVGADCDTEFLDFTTYQVTAWEDVTQALNVLESALASYPEGFFQQLRYDNIHRVEIQLVGTLYSQNQDAFPDSYVAFAQQNYDHSLVVADIYASSKETYYHEFSHLIDVYLEWDSFQREDALFSELRWMELNPDWFTGYSYQYGQEHELMDFTSFITSYATVSPTEDRARILEYAMTDHDVFEGTGIIYEKLQYYCQCIRDAFDTTGWPDETRWEQYL